METHTLKTSRFVLVSATCMMLALFASSRASAAPACYTIGKATSHSYELLWQYKSLAPSAQALNAAVQQTAKTFDDIGLDFHATLPTCGDDIKLPYDMLAAYWYEEETKVERVSQPLVNAMTQRLRDLHDVMPANNIFLAKFLRYVAMAYKQSGQQVPPDVATWVSDADTAADAECRMPYYQDATLKTWAAPPYPMSARSSGFGPGITYVRVTIDAHGRASDARVVLSSGNADIDRTGIDAARNTLYYPKTIYCTPQAGTYVLRIVFDPDAPTTAAVFRTR